MSTEKSVALVRRAVAEIWNGLDLDLADYLFDTSYVNHGGIIPDLVAGPESMKFAVALQNTAFPRLQIRERALVAEGNVVELKWSARRCPTSGGNADGGPIFVAHGTTLIRCTDDQIAESWTTWDCPVQGDVTRSDGSSRLRDGTYRFAG